MDEATKQAADDLYAAADHIDVVGLYQGGSYFEPGPEGYSRPRGDVACCALGAIGLVTGVWAGAGKLRSTHPGDRYVAAHSALQAHLFDRDDITTKGITIFSDAAEDAAEVTGLLRSAAAAVTAGDIGVPESPYRKAVRP